MAAVLKGIIEFDQFDDWLPDPVYLEDYAVDDAATVRQVEALLGKGQLPDPVCERLLLPRLRREALTGLTLPLPGRAVAHVVIGAFAERLEQILLREKVFGFGFDRKAVPLFEPPSKGLGAAYGAALTAAYIQGRHLRESPFFQVLDVVGFNRNARPERMAAVLRSAGVRPDEVAFVRRFLDQGDAGLPSIDDAFACIYNAYLQPVDSALAAGRVNFFRYRDEYFVVEAGAPGAVTSALKDDGLTVRLVEGETGKGAASLARKVDDAMSEIGRDFRTGDTQERTIDRGDEGILTATAFCTGSVEGDGHCTDRVDYEISYARRDLSVADLFALPADPARLDCVRILAFLRLLHSERRRGVLEGAPGAIAQPSFKAFRAALAKGRPWLNKVIAMAGAVTPSWHLTWACRALSDLAPLTEEESQLLLRKAGDTALASQARMEARLALARSSSIDPARFWTRPWPQTPYFARAELLGASYLARRGSKGAWDKARDAHAREERLVALLTPYVERP